METLEAQLGETTSRPELRRIARRHLQALRKFDFTFMWPQVHDFAGVEAIPIEGLEHLDEALERGKGAILATAHFGFGRMIKPVLRSRGRRVLFVGDPPRPLPPDSRPEPRPRRRLTRAERLARELRLMGSGGREEMGGDIAPGLNLLPCLQALEQNEVLVILPDGRRAQALHALPVAGIEIPFAPGAVSIARSTGAALLPSFVVDEPGRTGPASVRLVIHPPLDLQVSEDRRADIEENLRRFASVYEQQIRAYPHNFRWDRVRNGAFERPPPRGRRRASLWRDGYDPFVASVRSLVAEAVPEDGVVLVVSYGDDALLALDGRTAWHFPRDDEGGYGYNPADGAEAIRQLEAQRSQGATHIVFPQTALWWLEEYAGLRDYLEADSGEVGRSEAGIVYSLPVA